MPIYTLFLSACLPTTTNGYKDDSIIQQGYASGPPSLNTSEYWYNINWDMLFKNENYNEKYTRCRLRYKIHNQIHTSISVSFQNRIGVSSINLMSQNNLNGTTIANPIGLYSFKRDPTAAGADRYIYDNTTMESVTGVEFEIPKGYGRLQMVYNPFIRFTVPFGIQIAPSGLLLFELI